MKGARSRQPSPRKTATTISANADPLDQADLDRIEADLNKIGQTDR